MNRQDRLPTKRRPRSCRPLGGYSRRYRTLAENARPMRSHKRSKHCGMRTRGRHRPKPKRRACKRWRSSSNANGMATSGSARRTVSRSTTHGRRCANATRLPIAKWISFARASRTAFERVAYSIRRESDTAHWHESTKNCSRSGCASTKGVTRDPDPSEPFRPRANTYGNRPRTTASDGQRAGRNERCRFEQWLAIPSAIPARRPNPHRNGDPARRRPGRHDLPDDADAP